MANYLSKTLKSLALSDTTVAGYVATRCYYRKASKTAGYPYISFSFIADPSEGYFIGEDGGSPTVSWKIISQKAEEAEIIYEALRKKILFYEGTYEGIKINEVKHLGRLDLDFPEEGYYQITWDARVFFVHP